MATIRLVDAAKKLKISRTELVKILLNKGFFVENKYNSKLFKKHIEALAVEYARSVVKSYDKFNERKEEYTDKKRNWFQRFFLQFAKDDIDVSEYYSVSDVGYAIKSELDISKIERCFMSYMNSEYNNAYSSCFSHFIKKLKLKLKIQTKLPNQKSVILNILASRLFYVYVSEEDSNRTAKNNFSFSLEYFYRKACLIINSQTKHFYETSKQLNQKYQQV